MSRPLHIAIDARWIFPEISGIGLYTQELIAALARCSSPHQFTIIFNRPEVMARTAAQTDFIHHLNFSGVLINSDPFAPLDQIRLPQFLKKRNVDIYHTTNFMIPLGGLGRTKRVVTIHDLIPLLFRDHAPRSKKNRFFAVYKWLMHTAARKSDMIIAVSESTKRDVIQHLGITPGNEGKVRVIHEGVTSNHVPAERNAHDEIVFLFVGRRDPYKNLPMLVQALADLRKEGLPAKLRVIGSDDPRYPEAQQLAVSLGVNDHILWSGYVPDRDLLSAYQKADVFVLPSRYEGFGLPVLEAMACGTPVICSNTSSLPEVAGDAAMMMDPSNPASLTDAMRRLIKDPALRVKMSERGLIHAATFTWDETARKTLAVYAAVMAL